MVPVEHGPHGARDLRRVLNGTDAVLLDFDGPVCSVFAGVPADAVANGLRASLTDRGVDLPREAVDTDDPMVVLCRTAVSVPERAAVVERLLAAAEVAAVRQAVATPGARELLRTCRALGRPVAIVSNNTAGAVHRHLADQGLSSCVTTVVGRDPGDITRMKPDPYPLFTAVRALGSTASRAVMIGDTATDVAAARAAGSRVIGYLVRPEDLASLTWADAVVTDLRAIAQALVPAGPVQQLISIPSSTGNGTLT